MLRIFEANQLSKTARAKLLQRASSEDREAPELVREINDRVEREGESAVMEYTQRFDGGMLDGLMAAPAEFDAAEAKLSEELKDAFRQAYQNIQAFHRLQRESLVDQQTTIDGARLGFKYAPVEGAGVNVTGGKA